VSKEKRKKRNVLLNNLQVKQKTPDLNIDMKKWLVIFTVVITMNNCAFVQKNFEGVIYYTVNIDNINAPWFSIKASFKNNKILVETFFNKDSIVEPQAASLIDFDSGCTYEILSDEDKIIQDSIIKKDYRIITPQFSLDSSKEILGRNCTFIKYDSVHPEGETSGDMCLWFADSLYFSLPEKYKPYAPYILFVNGKNISLRASYSTYLTRNGLARLTTFAEKIEEMQLPDSVFSLPAGFSIEKMEHLPTVEVSDTEMEEVKKVGSPPPPALPSKQKSKPKKIYKKQ
jgi:hypothetical protein